MIDPPRHLHVLQGLLCRVVGFMSSQKLVTEPVYGETIYSTTLLWGNSKCSFELDMLYSSYLSGF